MDKWIGLGLLLWTLGFLNRFFGLLPGEENIHLPKWLSLFFLATNQNIPLPSLVFQTLGLSMIAYSLIISKLMPNGIITAVAGILIPTFFTRIFVNIARR